MSQRLNAFRSAASISVRWEPKVRLRRSSSQPDRHKGQPNGGGVRDHVTCIRQQCQAVGYESAGDLGQHIAADKQQRDPQTPPASGTEVLPSVIVGTKPGSLRQNSDHRPTGHSMAGADRLTTADVLQLKFKQRLHMLVREGVVHHAAVLSHRSSPWSSETRAFSQ